MTQAQVLYTLVTPRRKAVGRVIQLPETRAFLRVFLMQDSGELHIDERAAWRVMCDAAISEFHFLYEGSLYTTDKRSFWLKSRPTFRGYSLAATEMHRAAPWYEVSYGRGEVVVPRPPYSACQAPGTDFQRPHVPGKCDKWGRVSCLFCGDWVLGDTKKLGTSVTLETQIA